MFQSILVICIFMSLMSTQVSAGNYSFTVDKIQATTTNTGVNINAKYHAYPFNGVKQKNYIFSGDSSPLSIDCGEDTVVISQVSKRPSYLKSYKKITVGHKTNVYVLHEPQNSDVGDSYVYVFYFTGHVVTCVYQSATPPSFFNQIINSIKAVK